MVRGKATTRRRKATSTARSSATRHCAASACNPTPNLPPEVIANPPWYFNIYNFASWARATLLPLAVLSARRAVRPLPPDRRLDELFPEGRERMDYSLPRRSSWLSWRRLFLVSD